ncbi:45039_t:CDS:1, partial [Gigaspora margarita]
KMKLWDSNEYDDQGTMDKSRPFDDLFNCQGLSIFMALES